MWHNEDSSPVQVAPRPVSTRLSSAPDPMFGEILLLHLFPTSTSKAQLCTGMPMVAFQEDLESQERLS